MEAEGVTLSSSAPAATRVELDAAGRLLDEIACRSCGYNLRGLPVDGACPECLTAIGRSVHGDLLQYCDPKWVERLAFGARLYVISILIGILFGLMVGVIFGAIAVATRTVSAWAIALVTVIYGAIMIVKLIAVWQMTSPDPGCNESEQPLTTRAIARWALILSSLCGSVLGFLEAGKTAARFAAPPGAVTVDMPAWFLAAGTAVFALTGAVCLFRYAQDIARRVPDDKLARSTRIVMWGFVLTTALFHCVDLIGRAFPSQLTPSAAQPTLTPVLIIISILSIVALIPGVVFWIWGVVLAFKYRNRLRETARLARQTWGGGR